MGLRWSFFFFFFKQKTAYEVRISDWSSDVCSFDLRRLAARPAGHLSRRLSDGNEPAVHAGLRRALPQPRQGRQPAGDPARLDRDFLAAAHAVDLPRRPLRLRLVSHRDGRDAGELVLEDPKSVVEGTRVSGRVEFGGGRT